MKEILKDPMGTRIKDYEKVFESTISEKYFIIRLDGHKFSKFTKPFRKPYDLILSKAMIETSLELMKEFHPVFAYTQSDEITLGFVKSEAIFANGRIQKLISLTASKAAAFFNRKLIELLDKEEDLDRQKVLKEYLKEKIAYFDSRIFVLPSDIEMFNAFLWRQRDAEKNSKAMLSQRYFSQKELNCLKADEMIEKLKKEKGVEWEDKPAAFKYGTLIKKETYLKEGAQRKRWKYIKEKFSYSEENVQFLLSKVI